MKQVDPEKQIFKSCIGWELWKIAVGPATPDSQKEYRLACCVWFDEYARMRVKNLPAYYDGMADVARKFGRSTDVAEYTAAADLAREGKHWVAPPSEKEKIDAMILMKRIQKQKHLTPTQQEA